MTFKKIIFIIVLVFIMVTCNSNENAVFKGKVTDSTQNPLTNIKIQLLYNNDVVGNTTSDSEGNFVFAELKGNRFYTVYILNSNKEYLFSVYVVNKDTFISCSTEYTRQTFTI